MNFRNLSTSTQFITGFLVTTIVVLLCFALISYRHIQSIDDSGKSVMHSQQVHLELEEIFSHLKDAESSQRGYILTHDSSYLQPFRNARKNINSSYQALSRLVEDNSQQKSNLDTLSSLIDKRFSLLLTILNLSEKGYPVSSYKDLLDNGKDVMNQIRRHLNTMVDVENDLLQSRVKQYRDNTALTPFLSWLVVVFSLLIFISAYLRINRDLKVLRKLNNELTVTKEAFEYAEEISGISNWCWNLKNDQVTYSDNQFRLLGFKPHAFEPTAETLLQFVYPADKEQFSQWLVKATHQTEPELIFFRVLRNDGELRYFKAIGKLLGNGSDHNVMIAINHDITELQLNNKGLEEKNRELERTNAELASFNYVASHDLQEPLRKIQVFISRILEHDKGHFSQKGMEYFNRIQASARRMQALIDDLLMYTRTNKGNEVLEAADLNLILDAVKQELQTRIEEKNAIIESDHLPTMYVIPFQFQQLLTNLIGNSLKYSKHDIPPHIWITTEMVPAEMGRDITARSRHYVKISVRDNGIGFEQQHAQNIFTLFQRLHDKSEYSGTGIGLTICKKIVENHQGYITAEGIPNGGATFHIFLPGNLIV